MTSRKSQRYATAKHFYTKDKITKGRAGHPVELHGSKEKTNGFAIHQNRYTGRVKNFHNPINKPQMKSKLLKHKTKKISI